MEGLAAKERGLILVTGPTGSGKSTTLAALIDHINLHYAKNIITIEDPIEFLHKHKKSLVVQREVGLDTDSFYTGLKYALRQDPDVIMVGEMRDRETVEAALMAAQTGHLVLSTLHTLDAWRTINRIIDFFPCTSTVRCASSSPSPSSASSPSASSPRPTARAGSSPWRSSSPRPTCGSFSRTRRRRPRSRRP